LICNIHILPQTSLHEHYTVLLLEGRDGGSGEIGVEKEKERRGQRENDNMDDNIE